MGLNGHGLPGGVADVRTISILGSTGSVGTQTIDLLLADPQRYRVRALVAGRNAARLAEQARALRAEVAVISDLRQASALVAALAGSGVRAEAGPDAVLAAAALPVDWTMAAITGAVGLAPTLAAVSHGGVVALANKEALVCAGTILLDAVRRAGATLLPVDSEHNAIFQALADGNRAAVERIVLTASGGPFRTASQEQMRAATPAMALRHPIWSMGAKVSIDSATMMNKGLELIEAARLFDAPESLLDVLVHPQSTVHGLVHFHDGSVLAQLGAPDMRVPIAHALAWPGRIATTAPRLDLAALGALTFERPDETRFPCLRLARDALRAGDGAPTILNAANEIAVAAFLEGRIGFLDIAAIVEATLDRLGAPLVLSIEDVLRVDDKARRLAAERAGASVVVKLDAALARGA